MILNYHHWLVKCALGHYKMNYQFESFFENNNLIKTTELNFDYVTYNFYPMDLKYQLNLEIFLSALHRDILF